MRNYKLVFVLEILGFIFISLMAVAVEQKSGGLFGRNTAYQVSGDMWLGIAIFIFLLIPLSVAEFDSKLVGTLFSGVFVGGILEDFFWFLLNPNFGVQKFSPQFATWLKWTDLIFLKIPTFYLIYAVVAAFFWFVFVKNSKIVNSLYFRKIKKK